MLLILRFMVGTVIAGIVLVKLRCYQQAVTSECRRCKMGWLQAVARIEECTMVLSGKQGIFFQSGMERDVSHTLMINVARRTLPAEAARAAASHSL